MTCSAWRANSQAIYAEGDTTILIVNPGVRMVNISTITYFGVPRPVFEGIRTNLRTGEECEKIAVRTEKKLIFETKKKDFWKTIAVYGIPIGAIAGFTAGLILKR